MLTRIFTLCLFLTAGAAFTSAQEEQAVSFEDLALPRTANAVEKFLPSGWILEAQVSGDLNNDSVPDTALTLIEKPAADDDKDNPASRARVLMILFKNRQGIFERAATAKTLLQCTRCGGAFYGVMEASADVTIAKGVLIVKQDGGSRNLIETTYRFRYNPGVKKFALIGYDMNDRDRATGETTSESTNYLTGIRIKEIFQYSKKLDKDVKKSSRRIKINKPPQYLEQINYETLDND